MSIFGSMVSTIFGRRADPAPPAAPQDAAPQPPAASAGARPSSPPPPSAHADAAVWPQGGGAAGPPVAAAPRAAAVDVEAVLAALAARHPQRLDWRRSIVALMTLLGLDSGPAARKALARELNYPGDPGDTAAMDIWLHRQVLRRLAENSGKVPQDLRR